MGLENNYKDLLRVFLLAELTGFDSEEWDKVEQMYRNVENGNKEISDITNKIESWIYDFISNELEGDLITKFFTTPEVKDLIDKMRPIFISEINKDVILSINRSVSENKIKRFQEFESINESVDLRKVDINELMETK